MDIDIPDLRKQILRVFNEEDLIIFCADYFPEVRNGWSDTTSLKMKVQLLLDHCQQGENGKIPDLVKYLINERRDALPATFPHHPVSQVTESAKTGIRVLQNLLNDPDVREIATTLRVYFDHSRMQVKKLAYFKGLHDQLHTLEHRCLNMLEIEVRNFPQEEVSGERLEEYAYNLDMIIGKIRDVLNDADTDTTHEQRWIEDLDKANVNLQTALQTQETKYLKDTIRKINRVLATQPSYINANLIATARSLPLADLVQAVQVLAERITSLPLDDRKVHSFQTGTKAIQELHYHLKALVSQHDDWQTVDRELRRIQGNFRADTLEDFIFSWQDLKEQLEPLSLALEEQWASKLHKAEEQVDVAIENLFYEPLSKAFKDYVKQARRCFFTVDKQVKKFCDDLLELQDPLQSLQRVV